MENRGYTQEQKEWLIANVNNPHLAKEFNDKFKTNKKENTLRIYLRYHNYHVTDFSKFDIGIHKGIHKKHQYQLRKGYRELNETQQQWLKNNHQKYKTYVLMSKAFNETFNTDYTWKTMQWYCVNVLKIRQKTMEFRHPIGTLMFKPHHTTPYIKYRDDAKRDDCYMRYSDYLYEQYTHTKVKDNKIVIFIDGNYKNTDFNNLALIDRKIAEKLNGYRWNNKGVLTKAGIELLKTREIIRRGA